MSEQIGDRGVGLLVDVARGLGKTVDNLGDFPDFAKIKDGFVRNAHRLLGSIIIPSDFVTKSLIIQKLACDSAFEATGERTIDPNEMTPKETAIAAKRFQEKWEAPQKKIVKGSKAEAWMSRIYSQVVQTLSDDSMRGFEYLLASVAVGSWTIFEALSTDLLVSALDQRQDLAIAAIDHNKRGLGEDSADADSGGGKSKLKFIRMLLDEEPESIAEAGTIIRRSQKFTFDSLKGIVAAYECVFCGPAEKITKSLKFRDLEALEGVRNAVVHCGGIADRRFAIRIKRNREIYERFSLHEIKAGDPLPLEGKIVGNLAETAIRSSISLMKFVQHWIVSHPNPSNQNA